MEENGCLRAMIEVIGYEGIDGNIGRNPTPWNFIQAEVCLRVPASSHDKSILWWNGKPDSLHIFRVVKT